MFDADFLVMAPFNGVFWAVFLLFLLMLIGITHTLKGKSEKTKKTVIVFLSLLTFAWYISYKYFLSIDKEYNIVAAEIGGFNWWGELPLHLCNINMILMPIGIILNIRSIRSICFFVGPLGALMALLMPSIGFSGFSILTPRIICYYGIHFMIIVEGLLLATTGLYRPVFKDIPKAIMTTILLCFMTFIVNMVLRMTELYPDANYFFSVNPEGNPILEMLYGLIPVPFLYVLPCAIILGTYMLIVTLGFYLKGVVLAADERAQDI